MLKRMKSAMGILLTLCMICTMSTPLTAYADDTGGAIYSYAEDGTTRTGIKAISFNGFTYYDINKGEPGVKPETGTEVKFYTNILTGEPYDGAKNNDYAGASNQLEQWAEVAEKLFVKNKTFSTVCNAGGSTEHNYGERWGSSGYTDLSKALASLNGGSWGKRRNDYTIVSGLQYSDSLLKVRKKASLTIEDMIYNNALDNKYNYSDQKSDTLISHAGGDNCMKALNDDKKRDVLYTMVTCVDDEGDTYKYNYSSFVLAFYDFELVPIAPNGVSAITNAEGYGSIEEAAKKGAPGVSYKVDDTGVPITSFYANKSKQATNATMSFTESKSETVGNSYTSGESYSFKESVGAKTEFQTFLGLLKQKGEWSIGFEATQVLNTALTESKSTTKTQSSTVTASVSLPAETAAEISTTKENVDMTVDYNCPIALRYKVAITSMSGELYADKAYTWGIETAGYTHRTFSTVFGEDNANGAVGDLYARTVTNRNTAGYETAHGNTYGYYIKYGVSSDDKEYLNALDWNNILGDKQIAEDATAPISVEYREVDSNGVCTGRKINEYTYGKKYAPGYEYNIAPANTGEFEYTAVDYANPANPVDKECVAKLYMGKVLDVDATTELDNSFRLPGSSAKSVTLEPEGSRVIFYYQCMDPAVVDPGKDDDDEELPITQGTVPTAGNNPIQDKVLNTDEILSVVKWLGSKQPLSAAGATITYKRDAQSTEIAQVRPYYPLKYVLIANSLTSGDYVIEDDDTGKVIKEYIDGKDLTDGIELDSGEKFFTRGLSLQGLTYDYANYYGFKPNRGKWVRVVKDVNGNWIPDTHEENDAVASFTVGANSIPYVEAGQIDDIDESKITLDKNENGDYEAYFQYFIDDKLYSCVSDAEYVENKDVERDVIKFNVGPKDSDYTISLEGEYEGKVGQEFNLNDELTVAVMDSTGKEIEAPVTWEAKQLKGIDLDQDGIATFTKAGTYSVRATGKKRTSDWVTITAAEAPVLKTVEFKAPEFKTTQVTLTDDMESIAYDLPSFVTYKDQYGEDWTGDKPEIKFSLDDDYEGASIDESNRLVVTKGGEYKVYAEAEGYETSPVVIKVTDKRSTTVDHIDVAGPAIAYVGSDVNLNNLYSVSIINTEDREITAETKWEAKETEDKGIKVNADGSSSFTKPGTFNVRVIAGGVKSAWVPIEVLDERSLETIAVELPDFKTSDITLNQTKTSVKFDLNSYLTYYDQYGMEWTGDTPEIAFTLDKTYPGVVLDNGILTAKHSGTFKIFAEAEGYTIKPFTLTVKDNVSKITAKGTLTGVVGQDKRKLDKTMKVKVYDKNGREIEMSHTWEVKEATGLTIKSGTLLHFTKAGTYHVRAIARTGQHSEWLTVKGVKLEVKKPYIKKLYKQRKAFKARWSKTSTATKAKTATGYQIQYSTSSKFKKAKKIKITNYKTTQRVVKKLKAKKKYYVRVRAYKNIDGYTYYTKWSRKKSVKTR